MVPLSGSSWENNLELDTEIKNEYKTQVMFELFWHKPTKQVIKLSSSGLVSSVIVEVSALAPMLLLRTLHTLY